MSEQHKPIICPWHEREMEYVCLPQDDGMGSTVHYFACPDGGCRSAWVMLAGSSPLDGYEEAYRLATRRLPNRPLTREQAP